MRICVLTAGHLSTSPRMLKAADALTEAGHDVRVVSTNHVPWAAATDVQLRRTRRWAWTVVDYDRRSAAWRWFRSGVRHRVARNLAAICAPERAGYWLSVRAFSRVHDELVAAAAAAPADFYYGGTTGGIAATSAAARAAGVPFGVDLEDFYRGEHPEPALNNRLAAVVEDRVLPGAACLTTASGAMADAYADCCRIRPVVVHNTFKLPREVPAMTRRDPARLRFYWFSQTIGAGRGLEEAVTAIGAAGMPASLTLRGRPVAGYDDDLRRFAASRAPRLEVEFLPPASPDDMVDLCRDYDVGLSVEQPLSRNREVCLSNKALTYILGGMAVMFTDTRGHRELAADLGDAALTYHPARPEEAAEGLRRWASDTRSLCAAKRAAWSAAQRRWHWDHPGERAALVATIEEAVR